MGLNDHILAIFSSILACFFNALALVLMKCAHNRNSHKKNAKIMCVDRYWNFGFAMIILGSIFNVVAISYGNVMMLACTSSLSIIFNTIFAVNLLGEKLHMKRVMGIALICIGSTLFLILAKSENKLYT